MYMFRIVKSITAINGRISSGKYNVRSYCNVNFAINKFKSAPTPNSVFSSLRRSYMCCIWDEKKQNGILQIRNGTTHNTSSYILNEKPISEVSKPQHLNFEETDMDYVKFFVSPKNILNNVYDRVATKLKDNDMRLVTTCTKSKGLWKSTFHVNWPCTVDITQTGDTNEEASYKAALSTLIWLKENKKISKHGKPILGECNNNISDANLVDLNNLHEDLYQKFRLENEIVMHENKVEQAATKLANNIYNIRPEHIQKAFRLFPNCTNVLNNIFDDVNKRFGRREKVRPTHEPCESGWICNYEMNWPVIMSFSKIGHSKKDASYKAALNILAWLLLNEKIAQDGKYIDTTFIPAVNLANQKQQVRSFCTQSKAQNDKVHVAAEPEIKPDNEFETTKKLFPLPKNILHNVFDTVSRELERPELKLVPQYKLIKQSRGNSWICIYHLKWPEDLKFSHTSITKQEASNKAAIAVLNWLKQGNKINKHGQPMLVDSAMTSKIMKGKCSTIVLHKQDETNLQDIAELYQTKFQPLLEENAKADVNDDLSASAKLYSEDVWPKKQSVQQKYRGMEFYKAHEDVKLPITNYRNDIMKMFDENQVVIIKGEPGCGKSTRVPQYILENWAKEAGALGEPCRIIVTQPRRIAAISLAERVASERHENVGSTVGYQVRLKSNFNNHTGRLLYCTTGILLRRLQGDPSLSDCTHIILDEAHERDVNTDLLMNLLRRTIEFNPHLKLGIMSATIDTNLFQDYFDKASVIHVPGFTYPVTAHYLDNSKNLDLSKTREMCQGTTPHVVYEDVAKTINFIHKTQRDGAILCFLPGWEDIYKVRQLLEGTRSMDVLCLHSRLQDSEQWKIFSRPPSGMRKVILSTNIAETSVTIDDVVFVVDTGIQKEQRFDAEKGIMCIDNHWVSQSNVVQRMGRAGRVQPGVSYHLYPKAKFENFLKFSLPEIQRTSLTKIVLDSKVYSNNMDAVEFLAQLPTPPDTNTIMKAVEDLTDLELLDESENLTPLGRTLSDFQLEPKLAKSMVNAVIFKCVTPIVDIVTLFSSETELFSGALINKQDIQKVKKDFSKNSDHLSMMRLFEKWLEYVEVDDGRMASYFCSSNKLIGHKLATIRKLREIHFDYLFKGLKDAITIADDFSDSDEIVKGVLLSGVGTVLQHRNWDIVKGRVKNVNVLLTRHNQRATITSESVNFKRGKFPSDFLVYINETSSNIRRTTLIRETGLISPLTLLLFKNNKIVIEEISKDLYSEDIKSDEQVLLKLKGTKIEFICDKGHAALIEKSKDALQAGLQYYIFQLTQGGQFDEKADSLWKEILDKLNAVLKSSQV